MMDPNSPIERGDWREVLPAIVPFLYFGLIFYVMTNGNIIHAIAPQWLVNMLVFGQLALILLLIILGFFKSLRREFDGPGQISQPKRRPSVWRAATTRL